jgi:hypothetical protein
MNDLATGAPRLRPRSVAELIDVTFTLYRENFALFAGVVAVLAIPQTILNMIFVALTPEPAGITASTGRTVTVTTFGAMGTHAAGSGVLGVIFTVLITGALAQAVAARYLDRPETIGGAYSETGVGTFVRLFLALLVAAVVGTVAVGLIVLLFVVAAVVAGSLAPLFVIIGVLASIAGLLFALYAGVHLYLVPQVIVLERRGIIAAFRRSWYLVHGYFWHCFGLVILVGLMVGILSSIIGGLVGLVSLGSIILATGLSGILGILLQPISLGAVTLLYFDQRVRKEGFDLEYAAQRQALSPQ